MPFYNYYLIAALLLITAHQQSTETLLFRVPLVPLIPALSISANIALMVNLNPMTWVRFLVWVTIGNRPVNESKPLRC